VNQQWGTPVMLRWNERTVSHPTLLTCFWVEQTGPITHSKGRRDEMKVSIHPSVPSSIQTEQIYIFKRGKTRKTIKKQKNTLTIRNVFLTLKHEKKGNKIK
jgi:hypothetical protein